MTTPISLHDDLLGIPEIAALPAARAAELVDSIYSTLEAVVGTRLSAALTEEQLDDFAAVLAYQQGHPDLEGSPASDWLDVHVPNYRAVVLQEYGRVLGSIRSDPGGAIRARLAEADPGAPASGGRRPAGPRQRMGRPSVPRAGTGTPEPDTGPAQEGTPCPTRTSSPTTF